MNDQTTLEAPEEAPLETTKAKPQRISTFADLIEPNPFQPRKKQSEAEIADLAKSIEEFGLLQSIIVRLSPDNPAIYQIADGETRWRAISRLIDQGRLPRDYMIDATQRDYSDREMLEVGMISNIKRNQLHALDEAWGFAELEKMGMKQEEMATKFNSSQPAISNKMRLLKLPTAVQDALRAENLTTGHGIALLALDTSAEQGQWALRAMENGWSVKFLEGEIRTYKADLAAQNQPSLPEVEDGPAEMAGEPLVDVQAEPKPEVQIEVVPDVDPSQLPPAPPRDPEMTDAELEAFKGTAPTKEKPEAAEPEAEDQDEEKALEAESSSAPAPEEPTVKLPPIMAPVPAMEYGWMRSVGLTTGVALAHLRRFYTICESSPNLGRILEADGLGGALDYLETLHSGGNN